VRSARSGAALRMDFVCKKIKSVLMSQTGLINISKSVVAIVVG
jgi:hypothetical protein